jgi:hypothetical protein
MRLLIRAIATAGLLSRMAHGTDRAGHACDLFTAPLRAWHSDFDQRLEIEEAWETAA